jgi:hypothetical protein
MGQQGDLFNVGFSDWHKDLNYGLFTRNHGIAPGNTVFGSSNKPGTEFLIGN